MLKFINMVFLWYSNWSSESVSGLDKGKFSSAKNTCFGGFEQVSTLLKHDSSLSLHMEVLPRYQAMWKVQRSRNIQFLGHFSKII